jgi:hypothetical protein
VRTESWTFGERAARLEGEVAAGKEQLAALRELVQNLGAQRPKRPT